MKKKVFLGIIAAVAMTMSLTACGGSKQDASAPADTKTADSKGGDSGSAGAESDTLKAMNEIQSKYPTNIVNDGTPIKGGTLKLGIASDSPFTGILNGMLYSDFADYDLVSDTMCGMNPITPDGSLILDSNDTPINTHMDPEAKTITLKFNPKFKWSDGSRVGPDDIIKTYEILANKEYIKASKSIRYGSDMENIVGMQEYHDGKAKTIKGLEKTEPYTLVIHLKNFGPSQLWGQSLVTEAVCAKQYKGIPYKKIPQCDALRKNPLSYGPYVISSIVTGEKAVFKANKYYMLGEPKIPNVEISIVPTSQCLEALKTGKFDWIYEMPSDSYVDASKLENVSTVASKDRYLAYMGFKLGKWDEKKGENVNNPDAKMADKSLRIAMAEAIDQNAIGQKFYNGFRFAANSPIVPAFETFYDPDVKGYPYDLEDAKKRLDEAGYKDTNNDGFRENKDGKPLVINFAMMSGPEIAEPLSQYYIQQWKEIGLNVKLVDGRLLDFHNFYQKVQDDDPSIDVFMAAWGIGSNPDPITLYGKKSNSNMSRYTSPELQSAMEALQSKEALNPEKMKELYDKFQEVYMDEAFQLPTMYKMALTFVNKRVKNYDATPSKDYLKQLNICNLELTSDNPVSQSN